MAVPYGFGVGDFVAVGTLAWSLYKTTKDAPESFRNIHLETLSLHAVLKEAAETVFKTPLSRERQAGLETISNGCNQVLVDLDKLVRKYSSLDTQTKRTWERLKWCKEDIAEIRSRLTSHVTLLTAYIATSQAVVQQNLDQFIEDCRKGRHEGSIISHQTSDSLTKDERAVWRTIRKELEEIGITTAAFEANHDFIFEWFIRATESGAFREESSAIDEEGDESTEESDTDEESSRENSFVARRDSNVTIYAGKNSTELVQPTQESATLNEDTPPSRSILDQGTSLQQSNGIQRVPSASSQTKKKSEGQTRPSRTLKFFSTFAHPRQLLYTASRRSYASTALTHLLTAPFSWSEFSQEDLDWALKEACTVSNSPKNVEVLLLYGADANAVIDERSVLLHILFRTEIRKQSGFLQILDLLLENGADTNFQGPHLSGKTYFGFLPPERVPDLPLALCIGEPKRGSEDPDIPIIKRLLAAGANPNLEVESFTFLLQAVVVENSAVVQLLLQQGANPNTATTENGPPLLKAVRLKNLSIMTMLIDGGAQIERVNRWESALYEAAFSGHVDCAALLLNHGADVRSGFNNPRELSRSPICVAIQQRHPEMVRLLIRKGAVIDQAHALSLIDVEAKISQKGFQSLKPDIFSTLNLLLLSEREQNIVADFEQRQIIKELRAMAWPFRNA